MPQTIADIGESLKIIQNKAPDFTPEIAIILGSGIGPMAELVEDATRISYSELKGFPKPSVKGHAGELILGKLGGKKVACLNGRVHMYEGVGADPLKTMIRTMKQLGAKSLFITSATGSLHMDMPPGSVMLVKDHINMLGMNPLSGPNADSIGPRFQGMDGAYNKELRDIFKKSAKELNIDIQEGTALAFLGPTFETPAEIRMAKTLGGDSVGMSMIPDCIIARHCGLDVIGCAVITNFAAGMYHEELSHDHTLKGAKLAAEKLQKLVLKFLKNL